MAEKMLIGDFYREYGTKTIWLYTLGLWDTGATLDMNSRTEFEAYIEHSERNL